jgi:putative transposase
MELWHVLNRGVDQRKIFLDDRDRFRFVHGLLLFNTSLPATNTTFLLTSKNIDFVSRYRSEEKIVDVHGWCLMDNHYHLLLSEKVDEGITTFLRKLNIGYAKYFNEKYRRTGSLFQGRTKKILIENDAHFLHILNYIHLNPLDRSKKLADWRTKGISSMRAAKALLNDYPWSSYKDYLGKGKFGDLLTKNVFIEAYGDIEHALNTYSAEESPVSTYLLE